MKRFLIAPAIVLMLASPARAADPPKHLHVSTSPPAVVYVAEPDYTIVKKDTAAGVAYVRLAAELCEATDTAVESATQALYDALVSLPEVYEQVEVVNTDCQTSGRFGLDQLEDVLTEIGD